MFKNLRNRLILINLGITTIVLVVVFAGIYVVLTRSADERAPEMMAWQENSNDSNSVLGDINNNGVPDIMEQLVTSTVKAEKQAAANSLLISLIVSGLAIELIVAGVSYYLAEEAIKPVREAYESQKLFIANASHEIKTPLAAISANLEAADIKGNRWIDNVERETAKLTALNSELLALARTDLVTVESAEETDLRLAIEEVIESFAPRLKKHTFSKKIVLREKIKINRGDFVQILSILLDNAIKYSDKKIILFVDEHKMALSNDGAIIPAEALSHIFERFYQVDKSAEGVGLGLSIAKSLADRDGWKLSAESEAGMTKFVLEY
ncbi:HAMP domain-containing histidine kinase [Candidatus Saccharibacteria bacterium]|nr:HAMP domain-containing histidine kinase [Candidatus Saccharibacteria bacterium]